MHEDSVGSSSATKGQPSVKPNVSKRQSHLGVYSLEMHNYIYILYVLSGALSVAFVTLCQNDVLCV